MKRRSWSKSFVRAVPLPFLGGRLFSLVLLLLALLSFLISGIMPGSVQILRTNVTEAFVPVLMAVNKPIQDAVLFVRGVSGLATLQAENTKLIQENMRLREWYQAALILEDENKALRDLVKLKVAGKNSYISAQILADSAGGFVKSLMVSAGKADGARLSQAVISGDGVVGRVIEAGKHFSRVLLVTDISSRVPVRLEEGSYHAILAGKNEAQPSLDHLPPGAEVKVGSRVVTSGYGGLFPVGIPVGRIVRAKDGTYNVELFTDFDRMTHVRLVERSPDISVHSTTR